MVWNIYIDWLGMVGLGCYDFIWMAWEMKILPTEYIEYRF